MVDSPHAARRIPGAFTLWQLWHRDGFDRETPMSLETFGIGILYGLRQLWRHTFREGVDEDGDKTFSTFYLKWGDDGIDSADTGLTPFGNDAVVKLRQWGTRIGERELFSRLARRHLRLLQASRRSTAESLNCGEEGRQLLREVDAMTNPDQLKVP